jgi:hypothetical protein
MKHLFFTAFLGVVFILANQDTLAQLRVDAELRPRAELNNGYKFLRDTNDLTQIYVTQRTRLGFTYEKDAVKMRIRFQDVRTWGGGDVASSSGVFASTRGVDLYESWLELKLGGSTTLKAGRQELKYDDERLLATRNWNQYGISYDALVLKYLSKQWEFHAGASWNASDAKILGVTDGSDDFIPKRMRMLDFIYFRHNLGEKSYFSLLSMLTGFQNPNYIRVFNLTSTTGLHLNYRRGSVDGIANAFYQFGSNMYGSPTSAWMGTLSGGYRWKDIRLGAGADMLSGHDAARDGAGYQKTDHTFDIFYGVRFRYFGWMNQFSSVDASTRSGGLLDIYPNIAWYINEKSDLQLYVHFFRNQYPVPDLQQPEAYLEPDLGREYDVMYTYKIKEDLRLQAGFSWYDPSAAFQAIRGVPDSALRDTWWTWVMLCYTPRLY